MKLTRIIKWCSVSLALMLLVQSASAHNKVVVVPLGADEQDSNAKAVCLRESVDTPCIASKEYRIPLNAVYSCSSYLFGGDTNYFDLLIGQDGQLEVVNSTQLSYTFGVFFNVDSFNLPLQDIGFLILQREFIGLGSVSTVVASQSATYIGGACDLVRAPIVAMREDFAAPNGETYTLSFSTKELSSTSFVVDALVFTLKEPL